MRTLSALLAVLLLSVAGCAGSTFLGMFSTPERPQLEADPGVVLWNAVRVFEGAGIPVAEEDHGRAIRSERIQVQERWGADPLRNRISCAGGDGEVVGRTFEVTVTARTRRMRPGLTELYILDSVEPVALDGEEGPQAWRCSLHEDFRTWLAREIVRQTG